MAQTLSALCTRLCQPLLAKILCLSALMKHRKSSHCSVTRVSVSCSSPGLTYTRLDIAELFMLLPIIDVGRLMLHLIMKKPQFGAIHAITSGGLGPEDCGPSGCIGWLSFFSSMPWPRHRGQELRPIVSHCINSLSVPDLDPRRKLSVTYLINTLAMEHMCAFRQLPQLLFRLIIFKANQAALAGT